MEDSDNRSNEVGATASSVVQGEAGPSADAECPEPPACSEVLPITFSGVEDWESRVGTSPSRRLSALAEIGSPLHAIQIPSDILELAEEIVSRSDICGLDYDRLLFRLRAVLFLDRRPRLS